MGEFDWLDGYEITHPKKRAFLAAFAELGTVTHAADAAKITRKTHYLWMKDDDSEIYKAAFEDAQHHACDSLEREARRRAVHGTDKPVFHQGIECGTIREYSDTLLIFLMKGAMPEKYRDRAEVKHSGDIGLGALFEAFSKQKPAN